MSTTSSKLNSNGDIGYDVLHVTVLDGNNLKPTYCPYLNPYVRLQYGDNVSISDAHSGIKCDFHWSTAFPFLRLPPDSCLETAESLVIKVKDQNRGWKDSSVGKGLIKYQDLLRGKDEKVQETVELTHKALITSLTSNAGTLHVEYWLEKLSPLNAFPIPTLRLVNNHNIRGGVIRSMLDGGVFEPFPTWQIHLWEVGRIFHGDYSHWNESYPAAQKIFGPSVESLAIREAIRIQHSMLYSKDQSHGSYDVHKIQGISDFIRCLPTADKNTSLEKSVRFTYVILKNSHMHFSITSKKTAQDFLSKHALHNNAGPEVVFAGEFFIDNKSERFQSTGTPALIIDNNSGTFAPQKEKLHLLQTLLEFNFGKEYPIFSLDRSDPALNEYFEVNHIE